MKKLLALLMIIVCSASVAVAGKKYAHDATVLPKAAQATLQKNFKSKVSVVKIETTLGHVEEYEVIMTDGVEISFDKNGNWKNVETSATSSVPSAFVPKAILDYVSKNHKGLKIVGIEKERNGYDIELSNGIEMKFAKDGNFIRYDD